MMAPVLSFLDQVHWRPGIGDPTVMGWLIAAAYAAAAVACARAAHRSGGADSGGRGPGRRWAWVAVVMGLLCLNKQLDLQSLLTDLGRVTARSQGWYSDRREVQKVVVLASLAAALAGAAFVVFRLRRFWARNGLLLGGLILLGVFIAERAISFHHVDGLLKTRFIGVKTNCFLELTGIGLVWLAAHRATPARG